MRKQGFTLAEYSVRSLLVLYNANISTFISYRWGLNAGSWELFKVMKFSCKSLADKRLALL